jgi:predicted nuclease with TOPRIM domain
MIDPVSALGVAAAVFQFLESGCALITKICSLERSSSRVNSDLGSLSDEVFSFRKHVSKLQLAAASTETASWMDMQDMERFAKQCNTLANELLHILQDLKLSDERTMLQTVKLAWNIQRKSKALDKLRNGMEKKQRELVTYWLEVLGM